MSFRIAGFKISITYQIRIPQPRLISQSIKRVLRQACKIAGCEKKGEASIIFLDDKAMCALNRDYRGKNKTTNVLAFVASDSSSRATAESVAISCHNQRLPRRCTPRNDVKGDLGDIFISLPEAKRETKQYGWTIEYEIARLALHGFLHLLGYDHVKKKDAEVMEK